MVVAFFLEGPLAAMAASLAWTGVVALGSPPSELGFGIHRSSERPETVPADGLLAFMRMHGAHDVLLALPPSLMADAALKAAIDVAVSVGLGGCSPARPADAAIWHLASGGDTSNSHGRTPPLPMRLPEVHPTASAFERDGVPCPPPVRDALKLAAVLQTLAACTHASDVEACMREPLLADVPEGIDITVDRLRAIADRLDAMPARTSGPVRRRTASGTRHGRSARRRTVPGFDTARTMPGGGLALRPDVGADRRFRIRIPEEVTMSKTNPNAVPRPRPRHAPARRANASLRPGSARRGRTARPAPSLGAMSERHVAALGREIEMADIEDTRSPSGMNLDDSLLDPAFDEEHAGWDVHGHGQYRPRPSRMTAHFRFDGRARTDRPARVTS